MPKPPAPGRILGPGALPHLEDAGSFALRRSSYGETMAGGGPPSGNGGGRSSSTVPAVLWGRSQRQPAALGSDASGGGGGGGGGGTISGSAEPGDVELAVKVMDLVQAVQDGDAHYVEALLHDAPVQLQLTTADIVNGLHPATGLTALHEAIIGRQDDVALLLLRNGADPNGGESCQVGQLYGPALPAGHLDSLLGCESPRHEKPLCDVDLENCLCYFARGGIASTPA
eukprot:SM005175S17814  [mRNA]  locus=s5175:60:998:- [translate_table: standard]